MRGSLLVVLCLSLLPGCRSPEPRSPAVVRQKAAEKAAEPPEPSLFDQLPLKPEQRKVLAQLIETARVDFAAYDRTRLLLLDQIVVDVRAGAFDRKKLAPLIEQTVVEYERATPRLIHFANEVHRVLTAAQRKQLLELWDGDEDEDLSDEERRAKEEEELTRVLDLTGSQKTRLFTPLLGIYFEYYGPIGDFRRSWKEAKEAFLKDTFDAQQLQFFTALPLRTLASAAFDAAEAGLAVLEPAQRETLAVTIETDWRD